MFFILSSITYAQTTDDECNWAVLKAAKTVLRCEIFSTNREGTV